MSVEQEAREAAKARFYDSARVINPDPATAHVCVVSADAASEIWRPIAEALRDHMPMYPDICCRECHDVWPCEPWKDAYGKTWDPE